MLTIDCSDVLSIKNELVVYVSDQAAAIPTLKHNQFTLSTLDDDEVIDTNTVITSIKEFLDSIGEGHNFAVISKDETISIKSISGKIIERDADSFIIRDYSKIVAFSNCHLQKFTISNHNNHC